MKKIRNYIIILAVAALTAFSLAACGNSEKDPAPQTTETQAATVATADDQVQTASSDAAFTFTYKGTPIAMKADAQPVLSALGDCKSYTEEKSCAFDGLDKNFVYSSFILTTYPDGDMDRINSVTLQDDTVSTADGISIGDTQEKVEEKYGADNFNGINAYIMTDSSNQAQLTVIIDGGKVSSIQYAAKFD